MVSSWIAVYEDRHLSGYISSLTNSSIVKTSVEDDNLDKGYQWSFRFFTCLQLYPDVGIGLELVPYIYLQAV